MGTVLLATPGMMLRVAGIFVGFLRSPSVFGEGYAASWPRKDRGGRRRAGPLNVHSLIEWTVLACNLIRFLQLGYGLVAELTEARRIKKRPQRNE